MYWTTAIAITISIIIIIIIAAVAAAAAVVIVIAAVLRKRITTLYVTEWSVRSRNNAYVQRN